MLTPNCRSLVLAAAAIASITAAAKLAQLTPAQAAANVAPSAGLRMGELVGRDARVAIIGTDHGMVFSADEVAALLPGQDPRAALAQKSDEGTALMLAEPDRRGVE